jgi:phosphotransacetylase
LLHAVVGSATGLRTTRRRRASSRQSPPGADILVVPNLEAGNMLAKQLTFLSGQRWPDSCWAATVPIILTSRADSARTRLASCALGVLMARAGKAAE